tara:strand:+ start:126 stop:662 length:537 start_codon:yes stop_codon:yes gene_type:complete
MASEIRANKQTNRSGLGTVTYTDTGIIVSGIVTANSFKGDGSSLTGIDATALKDSGGNVKIQAQASGAVYTGIHTFTTLHSTTGTIGDYLDVGSNIKLGNAGVITATSFSGSGANLTNLPPTAPVGGASTNSVFFENDKVVAVDYQITSTKNAMSAGPISINPGIAVTVPSGCSWTIV